MGSISVPLNVIAHDAATSFIRWGKR